MSRSGYGVRLCLAWAAATAAAGRLSAGSEAAVLTTIWPSMSSGWLALSAASPFSLAGYSDAWLLRRVAARAWRILRRLWLPPVVRSCSLSGRSVAVGSRSGCSYCVSAAADCSAQSACVCLRVFYAVQEYFNPRILWELTRNVLQWNQLELQTILLNWAGLTNSSFIIIVATEQLASTPLVNL